MALWNFWATALLALVILHLGSSVQQLDEPYPYLHGNNPRGAKHVPLSPDPLVSNTWSSSSNLSGLQIFNVTTPVSWTAVPSSAFSGIESLSTGRPNITVHGSGTLKLDFGREHAAWFEFTSPDLDALSEVSASISEYNQPWPGKTLQPNAYAGGNYRLETNPELYEGVRYAWISVDSSKSDRSGAATAPWHITGLRLVAQSKPTNYTGSFRSADPTLTAVWYSGAYGSRLNMMPYGFNSILMDRGDRVSIQGDGHPVSNWLPISLQR